MELRNLKEHLIEELSKLNSENTLNDLARVLKKHRKGPSVKSKLSDFAGIWNNAEAEEMKRIITSF